MGNTCIPEDRGTVILNHYTPLQPSNFTLAPNDHSRFGDIQKIRTKQTGVYKLIMACNGAVMQTITVECRVLISSADFQLYPPAKMRVMDLESAPIFDPYDTESFRQVYHKIRTQDNRSLTMKVYPFLSFRDVSLKQALNEIHICQSLANGPLLDYFIMSRGNLNTMVLIFKNYEANLMEVLHYREQIRRPYLQWEMAVIWKGLISNYKQLMQQNIVHRDIRLSKILFNPNSPTQPFQFGNLESARKLDQHSASRDELMTVRGVDTIACSPVKQKIKEGENVGLYDATRYDLDCLIKVLLAIEHIDPWQNSRSSKENQVLKQLGKPHPDLTHAQVLLEHIIRQGDPDRSISIQDDRVISRRLIELELRQAYKDRIKEANFECLLAVHNKPEFNKILMNQIDQNQKLDRKEKNLPLLHRVGSYYQNVGLTRNEYYQEEISLMLELAKQFRQECFYADYRQFLAQAENIHDLHSVNQDDNRVRIELERLHVMMHDKQIDQANQQLSVLLELANSMKDKDLPLQVEVLQAKVKVQVLNHKFSTAENTLSKMGAVLSDEKQFQLITQAKRAKAELQALRAFYFMELMREDRSEINLRTVGSAEVSIDDARNLLAQLPETPQNTVKLIEICLLHSQLFNLREEYTASRKQADSAEILMQDLEKDRPVSLFIKKKVLQRLKEAHEKEGNLSEHYQAVLKRLDRLRDSKEETNAERHARVRRSKKLARKSKARLQKDIPGMTKIVEIESEEDEAF